MSAIRSTRNVGHNSVEDAMISSLDRKRHDEARRVATALPTGYERMAANLPDSWRLSLMQLIPELRLLLHSTEE